MTSRDLRAGYQAACRAAVTEVSRYFGSAAAFVVATPRVRCTRATRPRSTLVPHGVDTYCRQKFAVPPRGPPDNGRARPLTPRTLPPPRPGSRCEPGRANDGRA